VSILNSVPDKSLGTVINRAHPEEIIEILEQCAEALDQQYGVDVTDLQSAIEMLEYDRDYEVDVSITFDLTVRVTAKDEQAASRIVEDEITAIELVNGDWNDFVQDIDMQSVNLEIHEIDEA
jgi:hypothetical protein